MPILTKHSPRSIGIMTILRMNGEYIIVIFKDSDQYEVIRKIGRGKYSDVYEGIKYPQGSRVVIKVLKPVKK
jgi:serine/threonine protein kinase